jgi:hypothetical protein
VLNYYGSSPPYGSLTGDGAKELLLLALIGTGHFQKLNKRMVVRKDEAIRRERLWFNVA